MNTVFPPGYVSDPEDPFCGSASVAWSRELQRLRDLRPRPLTKRYGLSPTDEQRARHDAEEKTWARLYRAANKAHKRAVA